MPPYGMGLHAKALERDAPNGRGDPPGRPYEAAMVATARNGKVAIKSWNATNTHVCNLVAKARVLSFGSPIRPHSTHPPVGPFRCGRMGHPASGHPPDVTLKLSFALARLRGWTRDDDVSVHDLNRQPLEVLSRTRSGHAFPGSGIVCGAVGGADDEAAIL